GERGLRCGLKKGLQEGGVLSGAGRASIVVMSIWSAARNRRFLFLFFLQNAQQPTGQCCRKKEIESGDFLAALQIVPRANGMSNERLRVLYAASEVAGFAKTGGLGGVAGAFARGGGGRGGRRRLG